MSEQYQQYDQKDKQMEQEIQYHVYQDLANVLGLLTDTVQTMNFFGQNKNHPYVPIIYEKLKLQMILSNGIHFDIKQTHQKNKNYMDLLFKEKEKALNIFANIIKDQFKDVKDQFISNCIKMYYENILLFNDVKYLNMDENLQQQQPISISDGRFNQQVVQKVLNGMFEVSHYKSLIAKGQYQCLTEVEIREMTLARAELVKQKLSENYPEFAIKAPKVQQQLISNIESDQYSISGQSTEINNLKVQQSSKKYISPNPIPQVHQLDNQNKKQVQEGNFCEKNIPSSGRGKQDKTRETAQPQRTSHDSNKSQKGKSKPLKSAEQQQLINPIQGDTATRMEEESEKLYFPSKISQNLKQFLNSIFIVLSPKWPNEDQKNKYSNQLTLSDEDYDELTRLSGQFNTNFMKHLFQIILDQRFAKNMKTDQLEKDIEIIQQYIKY